MSLDPRLENQVQAGVSSAGKRDALPVDPRLAEKLIRRLAGMSDDMMRQGREPVLLCGSEVRRAIRVLTRRAVPKLSVLSVRIPMSIDLRSHGIIRVELEDSKRGETTAPSLAAAAGPSAGFA